MFAEEMADLEASGAPKVEAKAARRLRSPPKEDMGWMRKKPKIAKVADSEEESEKSEFDEVDEAFEKQQKKLDRRAKKKVDVS